MAVGGLLALASTATGTAHAEPQLTADQMQDAVNMSADWCAFVEYSDSPAQGAMLAMDLADMDFNYAPWVSAAMVSYGVQRTCPQYLNATLSAAQTWTRKQSVSDPYGW